MAKFNVLVILLVTRAAYSNGEKVKIGITHWNDVSGQLQSFRNYSSGSSKAPTPCPNPLEKDCVGGIVNMVHAINENAFYEESGMDYRNIFRFDAGNFIGGESGWLPCIPDPWKKYAELLKNHYGPNVTALGTKEFGAGVSRTVEFISTLASPPLIVNTCKDTGIETLFCNGVNKVASNITVYTSNGTTDLGIGIIGFVDPLVERLSIPGKLLFSDIVLSVQNEVAKDARKSYIAIGDANFNTAKRILELVPQVKLVIYSNGFTTTNSEVKYPYEHGNYGFTATAGRYGSSVGKLIFEYDTTSGGFTFIKEGRQQTSTPTNPNPAAKEAQIEFEKLKANVDKIHENIVGYTRVTLKGGENCWRNECNMGNLMTDAVVICAYTNTTSYLPHSLLSIWHGGAFFEDDIAAGDSISEFDIHKWLPYHNRAHFVSISGANLKRVFEASATGINPAAAGAKDWRQFLQVSDRFQVQYNYDNNGVPKLTNVKVIIDNSEGIPLSEEVKDDETYYMVIPTYLYESRGVYNFTVGYWTDVNESGLKSNFAFDDDCLEGYIKAFGHVSVGLEQRITISGSPPPPPTTRKPGTGGGEGDDNGNNNKRRKGFSTAVNISLAIIYVVLFAAVIYVGYVKVLPKLRSNSRGPTVQEMYPPNQS